MQIKLAKTSGFCFGVKRAINIAETTLKASKYKNIYSLGPIIHNPQVVGRLAEKGLKVVDTLDCIKNGIVIISSHGAPEDIIQKIRRKGTRIVDATCPFVKHAHHIVEGLRRSHYKIIVVGDKEHPEVKTLLSLAGPSIKSKKIGIVSQTTQNKDSFLSQIYDILKTEDFTDVKIFNTICKDTLKRQALTRKFLEQCDVMVVIGGKNSANTKRLHQICKVSGVDSYHIEVPDELKKDYFVKKRCAGVVSGASAPHSMVKKVVETIRRLTDAKDEG